MTYHINILVYIIWSINYDIEVSTRADLGLNLWSVVIFTVYVGQFAGQYDIFAKRFGWIFGGIVILAGVLKSPLSHFRRSGRPYFWNPFWKFIFCKFSGQVLDLPRWRHNPSWSNRSVNMLKRLSPLLRVPNVQTYQKIVHHYFKKDYPPSKSIHTVWNMNCLSGDGVCPHFGSILGRG